MGEWRQGHSFQLLSRTQEAPSESTGRTTAASRKQAKRVVSWRQSQGNPSHPEPTSAPLSTQCRNRVTCGGGPVLPPQATKQLGLMFFQICHFLYFRKYIQYRDCMLPDAAAKPTDSHKLKWINSFTSLRPGLAANEFAIFFKF